MLYFEDFMEDIEGLPYEFKENLTAIRQLDLQVQNIMEPLDARVNEYFQKCSQNSLSPTQQAQEYEKILKEFDEVEAKNADKIMLTDQMKDTFNKMIKKLDIELNKFKLELEADTPGSAEAIESMVNQQIKSGVTDGIQRVDRKRIKRGRISMDNSQVPERKVIRPKDVDSFGYKTEKNDSFVTNPINTQISSQSDALMTTAVANGSLSPASSFGIDKKGSLKRKFDWKHTLSVPSDKTIKSERKRHKMMSALSEDSGSNLGTNDELGLDDNSGMNNQIFNNSVNSSSIMTTESEQVVRKGGIQNDGMSDGGSSRTPGSLNFGLYNSEPLISSGAGTIQQISHDSSQLNLENDVLGFEEQKYCFCNDVSYGDMIACDGANCPREWFHYACVNLVVAPKGSWFCRDCKTKNRQRRG